jgi:hypothetical protein
MFIRCKPIGLALLAVLAGAFLVLGVGTDTRADELRKTEATPDKPDLSARIDAEIDKVLKRDEVTPAPPSSDAEFLRRVYLDVIGLPPGADEARAFLDDESEDKRERLIEKLLDDPRFGEHIADQWLTILVGRGKSKKNTDLVLGKWIADAVNSGRPFNELIYEMLAAEGTMADNPGVAYYTSKNNLMTPDIAGEATRHFLGVQIQCAQCHDHPYEDITESDFEGMEAFFKLSSTGQRGQGADRYWFTRDKQVHNKHDASSKIRLKGDYMFPTYLGRQTWEFESEDKLLRESLAEWMTSPDNKWFREMGVNRYMAYFLGNGFVTPVDDFNSMNVPTFPVVLEQMGKDFAASGYDTRYLIRAIVNSELYQREVETNRTNRDDFIHYSRAFVRKLTPEQIERSVLHVVGIERLNPYDPVRDVPDNKLTEDEKKNKKIRDSINGWKRHIGRLMNEAYGTEPETRPLGDYDGTIVQALLFLNADLMGPAHLKNSLDVILETYEAKDDRVRAIFETVLGRRPDKRDSAILNATAMRWKGENDAAYVDLFVALMNTTEFVTNH